MSEVKHFHKKEAAKILIELRNKTEDERLMDYRRQLLNRDNNLEEMQNSSGSDFQERMEHSCWPWAYPNLALSPYNINTIPIGYPTWTPNPQFWFPSSPSYMPDPATNPYNMQAQSFHHGMEYQTALSWPTFPHQQAYVDPGQCNRRRRTKFTNEQLAVLEKTFTHGSKFPSPGERMRLESRTGLSKEKISVWFQNRRAKEKREKGQDGAGSKEESTTTDSELETEDERQLSICDETPEEDSEIDDTRNIQSNTQSEMEAPHSEVTFAVDSSGFYHSEITSSFALSAQLTTSSESFHDQKPRKVDIEETSSIDCEKPGKSDFDETASINETASIDEKPTIDEIASIDEKPNINETASVDEKPRKRDIHETASIDEKTDVMTTAVSSNNVLNIIKKDINIVEDFDSLASGSDNFMFQRQSKKLKTTEEDMFNTTVTAQSTEHRMFGET